MIGYGEVKLRQVGIRHPNDQAGLNRDRDNMREVCRGTPRMAEPCPQSGGKPRNPGVFPFAAAPPGLKTSRLCGKTILQLKSSPFQACDGRTPRGFCIYLDLKKS